MLKKVDLIDLYLVKGKSVADIAKKYKCSETKVNYWLSKYFIQKRTISDAMYLKYNPTGDPFVITKPKTTREHFLFGLGMGLYWGEGNKRAKNGIRIGNIDPKMIVAFIHFLEKFFKIDRNKLRFELHIFEDLDEKQEMIHWASTIGVRLNQFYKTILHASRGSGTYTRKVPHGVLTLYFNNTKLQKYICESIEKI